MAVDGKCPRYRCGAGAYRQTRRPREPVEQIVHRQQRRHGPESDAARAAGKLQYLSLKQLPIVDEQIATLPDFPDLQYLGLDGTKIGDAGLKSLARYPLLQVLWLDNTPVTDAGLVHLRSLASLRTLYLPGTLWRARAWPSCGICQI